MKACGPLVQVQVQDVSVNHAAGDCVSSRGTWGSSHLPLQSQTPATPAPSSAGLTRS